MPGRSGSRKGGEPLNHPHIVWVRRRIVVRDVVILLGSLQDQRNAHCPPIPKQPFKRLLANLPLSHQDVPVLVGPEGPFTVIEVKEGWRGSRGLLELVEDSFE